MNIVSNSGKIAYGVKRYILQSDDEVANLPLNVTPGSSAKNFLTGKEWVFVDRTHGWVQVKTQSGGGSGGGNDPDNGMLDESYEMSEEEILEILK